MYERGGGGGWTFSQRIDKPQGFNGTGFGSTLALDGDIACIGGPGLTVTAGSAGGLFAYTRDAAGVWSLLETVQPTGLGIADRYAQAAELQGGTLAVGAPQHNGQVNDEGAVWIFEFDAVNTTFGTPTKITPHPGRSSESIRGGPLALDQDRLLVGAPRIDSVYVFERAGGTWSQPAADHPFPNRSEQRGGNRG